VNRARSPFFFVSLLLFCLLAAAFAVFLEAQGGPAPWKTPENLDQVRQISIGLMGATGALVAVLMLMELAIRRGWEPKWLRVRYVGAVVLLKEPDSDDPSRGWITFALPNKEMERFHADPSEFHRAEESQAVMVEVIGQYVAELRRMGGESAKQLEAEAAMPANRTGVRRSASLIKPESAGLRTWVTVLLLPIIGGMMIGNGALALVMGSADYTRRRRYSTYSHESIYSGETATWYGTALVALGILILVIAIVVWYRGWNEGDFGDDDELWDEDLRRGCRGRYW
jgi:hypothetical protein